MYRCERRTLSVQEQESRSPADEWCSAAVVIATTEQKEVEEEEKGGYWGRKENGIKKREGEREGIIKGTQFCRLWTELRGHIRSQAVREKGGMVSFDRNMGFNETYTVFLLDQDIPACPCFTLETLFVQLQPCFMSKLKRLQVYCVPASLLSGASLGCKHPVLNVFY